MQAPGRPDEDLRGGFEHGRHRDARLMADDLIGSALGEDYPQAAICEVCGRIVEWPNGQAHPGVSQAGVGRFGSPG